MPSENSSPIQPFWIDESSPPVYVPAVKADRDNERIDRTSIVLYVFEFIVLTFIAGALKFSVPAWLFLVAVLGWFPLMSLYVQRRAQAARVRARDIQQRARDLIGASVIGSAIHVAEIGRAHV